MNKLLLGLLIASTNAFAVGDYELAEKKLAACKLMGDVAISGYKLRKNGDVKRETVASPEFVAVYGREAQEAVLYGWDADVKSEDGARMVAFSKCMDKYSYMK